MSRDLLPVTPIKVTARTFTESVLAVALIAGAYYFLAYVPKHVKAGEPVVALANYFLTYAPIQSANQPAYVIPGSAQLWDTPAEIRVQVATLHEGDEVQALGRYRGWTHVRTTHGQDGWTNSAELMAEKTHDAEEHETEQMVDISAQAFGHTVDECNLHVEPSRQAAIVDLVSPAKPLEILGRTMTRRIDGDTGTLPASSDSVEAWYLVREGSHIGWILGRRVELDIPRSLSAYAQETNLVAWLVLDTVNDDGNKVPQYLLADRVGTADCDYTDIRVLTWWKKKQTYAIAYKQGGLQGYFPIVVSREGTIPQFRLRLIGDDGVKIQKVYGLFDTITRAVGIAGTWEDDAEVEPLRLRSRNQIDSRTP